MRDDASRGDVEPGGPSGEDLEPPEAVVPREEGGSAPPTEPDADTEQRERVDIPEWVSEIRRLYVEPKTPALEDDGNARHRRTSLVRRVRRGRDVTEPAAPPAADLPAPVEAASPPPRGLAALAGFLDDEPTSTPSLQTSGTEEARAPEHEAHAVDTTRVDEERAAGRLTAYLDASVAARHHESPTPDSLAPEVVEEVSTDPEAVAGPADEAAPLASNQDDEATPSDEATWERTVAEAPVAEEDADLARAAAALRPRDPTPEAQEVADADSGAAEDPDVARAAAAMRRDEVADLEEAWRRPAVDPPTAEAQDTEPPEADPELATLTTQPLEPDSELVAPEAHADPAVTGREGSADGTGFDALETDAAPDGEAEQAVPWEERPVVAEADDTQEPPWADVLPEEPAVHAADQSPEVEDPAEVPEPAEAEEEAAEEADPAEEADSADEEPASTRAPAAQVHDGADEDDDDDDDDLEYHPPPVHLSWRQTDSLDFDVPAVDDPMNDILIEAPSQLVAPARRRHDAAARLQREQTAELEPVALTVVEEEHPDPTTRASLRAAARGEAPRGRASTWVAVAAVALLVVIAAVWFVARGPGSGEAAAPPRATSSVVAAPGPLSAHPGSSQR